MDWGPTPENPLHETPDATAGFLFIIFLVHASTSTRHEHAMSHSTSKSSWQNGRLRSRLGGFVPRHPTGTTPSRLTC